MTFTALLPSSVRKRRVTTKKHFLTLVDDNREWYWVNRLDGMGEKRQYKEILPPVPNPKLALLRKKLTRAKLTFTETAETSNGIDYIRFHAITKKDPQS